jgi:hypothetical protein
MNTPSTRHRIAIHAFVAFYLLAVSVSTIPDASQHWERLGVPWVGRLHSALKNPLMPLLRFAGVTQGWSMFSRPPRRCFHLEAEVTFADGTRTTWRAPLLNQLGQWERVRDARFHKWVENLVAHKTDYIRPDAARYIARRFPRGANPPVAVDLVRRWADIELPTASKAGWLGTRVRDRWTPLDHAKSETLLRYAVRPADLQ